MITFTKGAIASSRAGTSAFSPDSLDGLELWLDSDFITGLEDGDAMGDNQTRWVDRSGNSRDFYQSVSAAQPEYQTNSLNGRAGVHFQQGDQLYVSSEFQVPVPCTIFMVKNQSATNIASKFIGGDYNGDRFYIGNEQWSSRLNFRRENYIFIQNSNSVGGLLTTYVVSGTNSTLSNKNTSASLGDQGTSNLHIRYTGEPNEGPNGSLYEVLVYNNFFTETEKEQVESYLRDKWGSGI